MLRLCRRLHSATWHVKKLRCSFAVKEDDCKIMLLCRVALGNVKKLPPGQDRSADRFADDPSVAASDY